MVQFALSLERLFAARRRTGGDLQEMEVLVGTIAEAWLAEGEARGEARGKAEAVLRLARLKIRRHPDGPCGAGA